ncbi:hypothetical protein [Pedobacter sp. NJ-S-72]
MKSITLTKYFILIVTAVFLVSCRADQEEKIPVNKLKYKQIKMKDLFGGSMLSNGNGTFCRTPITQMMEVRFTNPNWI